MKASACLAGLAALALAFVVALIPSPANAAPGDNAPARDLDSLYANTAIGAVIDANDGMMPTTGAELVKALAKLGDFVQLPVSFSAVALNSGLKHPRVVFTMRPSTTPPPKSVFVPDSKSAAKQSSPFGGGGWGIGWAGPTGTTKMVPQPPEPLNQIAANRTQFQGRLFLAANTELTDEGIKVHTVEFISWNSNKLKFDFGVIEGLNAGTTSLKILDGVRCFSCHKNRGPILGVAPWSNTAHNNLVRNTAADALTRQIKLPNGTELEHHPSTDGLNFGDSHAMEVDAAVRIGGDLLRDRAIFKQLAENDEGRKALVFLFDAILVRRSLEKHDKEIAPTLNSLALARFARNATTARHNALPSTLRDFSPAGPVTKEIRSWVGGEHKNQVARHDDARAAGNARLPSEFLPSNPKAFVRPVVKATQHPAEAVNAVLLAQTIGLSEKDRTFLADALDEAVKRLNNPAFTPATVAYAIFTGPAFADVMATGNLPDRDDFKDRVVAGIIAVLRSQKLKDEFWTSRVDYASTPKFDPHAKPEKELVTLPSHACLACHDIRGTGKAAFNPIPALAFDPFDATARDAWLKGADRKQKAEVLARLMRRLGTDKDMPPEDSTEAAMYRVKDPAALNAVQNWLDAELKKVK